MSEDAIKAAYLNQQAADTVMRAANVVNDAVYRLPQLLERLEILARDICEACKEENVRNEPQRDDNGDF